MRTSHSTTLNASPYILRKLTTFSWMEKLGHYFTHALLEPKFAFKFPVPWLRKTSHAPRQIKYNPNSKYIGYIIASQTEAIIINSTTGHVVTQLEPLYSGAKMMALEFHSQDDSIFLGLSSNIELRSLQNNALIKEYKGFSHSDFVDLKCSNSGKYLVAASSNGQITVFDAKTGVLISSNKKHHHLKLTGVFITDNEETLISTSPMEVRLWDIKKLDKWKEVVRIPSGIHNLPVVISSTYKHFFVNVGLYNVAMYSLKTKEVLKVIEGNRKVKIVAIACTKDEKILITLMADAFIRFFDINAMQEIALFKIEALGEVEALLLPPDERFFTVLFRDGTFQALPLIDDMKTIFDQRDFQAFSPSTSFVLTQDQQQLIVGTQKGSIDIIDLSTKAVVFSQDEEEKQSITAIVMSPDETTLITGNNESFTVYSVHRRDYFEIREQYKSPHLFGAVRELALISQNTFLAVGLTSNKIHIYDTKKYELLQALEGYWWRAHAVFNQLRGFTNRVELAVGTDDGTLNVFQLKNEKFAIKERFPNLFSTPITAVAVSNDFLVAGSQQGSLKIVFITKNAVRTLPMIKDKSGIHCVDISSDELNIVAASSNTITLYDVRLQLEIHSYTSTRVIHRVHFIPGGKGIGILHEDGSICLQMFPFFTDLNVIDYSLPVPYRASSTLPEFKLMKLFHQDIKITPELVHNFSQFYTNPYNINFWQYYFHTQDFEESPVVVKMIIDANIPIINDKDGKNIIHYLLKKKKRAVLNVIFKHAEQAFRHSPPEVFESLSNILPEIISTTLPALPSFLEACVGPPEIVEGRYLPRFGDATGRTPFVLSTDRKLKPEIKKQLIINGIDPLTFYTSKISLDDDFSSEENVKLLETIFEYKDMNIYNSGLILKIIEWAWKRAKPFLFFLVLDSFGFMAMVLTYGALGMSPFWLELLVFIHNCFLVVHEFLQFLGNWKSYFTSIWNICDLLRLLLIFCSIGLRWRSGETISQVSEADGVDNTIALLMIFGFFFNYLKLITYLRIFTATRRFIRLFVEIIKDMLPFVMLVLLFTMGFSFINFQLFRDETFGNAVQKVYRMLFADFDSTTDYTVLEGTFFGIMSFLSAVVLMNLLVSFLGDTYGRVQQNTVSSDYYEKLDLVLEYIYIKRTASRLLCIKRKKRMLELDKGQQRKYIFWVIETSAEDDAGHGFGSEGRIRQTRKEFRKEVIDGNTEVEKQFEFVLRNLNTVRDLHEIVKKTTKKQNKAVTFVESKMDVMKEELTIFRGKVNLPMTMRPTIESVKLIPIEEFRGVTKTSIPEEGGIQNMGALTLPENDYYEDLLKKEDSI